MARHRRTAAGQRCRKATPPSSPESQSSIVVTPCRVQIMQDRDSRTRRSTSLEHRVRSRGRHEAEGAIFATCRRRRRRCQSRLFVAIGHRPTRSSGRSRPDDTGTSSPSGHTYTTRGFFACGDVQITLQKASLRRLGLHGSHRLRALARGPPLTVASKPSCRSSRPVRECMPRRRRSVRIASRFRSKGPP